MVEHQHNVAPVRLPSMVEKESGQNDSSVILAANRSADAILGKIPCEGYDACKQEDPPWLWNLELTSPEARNSVNSGPTKGTDVCSWNRYIGSPTKKTDICSWNNPIWTKSPSSHEHSEELREAGQWWIHAPSLHRQIIIWSFAEINKHKSTSNCTETLLKQVKLFFLLESQFSDEHIGCEKCNCHTSPP